MKTPQAVVIRSRLPLPDVCSHYTGQVGRLAGISILKDFDGAQKYCNIVASENKDTLWQAIAIMPDPSSAGAVMVSMSARMN